MITVSALHHHYPGAPAPAVQGVSFTVPRGHIFGFLGPSGAGKSTVQKLLIGLLPLQSGEIRYDDQPLGALGRAFFARVGVSFEHPNLFPRLSGLENLWAFAGLYGGARRDPQALLEAVGLGEASHQPASEYSKGMKQRLVFARALQHAPDFLFLDEPTSGLDPGLSERVRELIRAERDRGAAVLLTTHDMELADTLCDTVAFLHQGRVAALDSPRALKLAHGQRLVRVERREAGGLVGESLSLDSEEGHTRLATLLRGGQVETVHSQEATLAQVFLRLTGQGLHP